MQTSSFAREQRVCRSANSPSRRLPFAAWAFVIAGIASMGLPGFSGFVAELQVLIGSWSANPLWTAASGIGIIVGIAYIWRALQKAFFSDTLPTVHELESEHAHKFAPICWSEMAGVALLVACTLVVGVYPRILLDSIEPAHASVAQYHVRPKPLSEFEGFLPAIQRNGLESVLSQNV